MDDLMVGESESSDKKTEAFFNWAWGSFRFEPKAIIIRAMTM